jgi:hypothetical protein
MNNKTIGARSDSDSEEDVQGNYYDILNAKKKAKKTVKKGKTMNYNNKTIGARSDSESEDLQAKY